MFLENMPSIHHATFRPLFPQDIDRKPFSKKQANLPRCNFKVIPPPCKAASEGRVYQLYGDIVLMESGGMLSFETSLLNKFKTFKEVQITKLSNNQKLATIFPESKKAFEPYDWALLIERLRQMGNLDSLEWAEIINDFCSKSKVAIELCSSGKELIGDKEKELFKQITTNSREKRASLLEAHPCLLVKTSLKQTGFGLSEISFNEKFLSEIGYSMDTFSSSVLQEGIAQLMPHDDKISSDIMKAFMKNCFEINSNLSQVLEFNSVVFMKCGYMKNVKLQVHFLPIYENGFFELDRVLVVTSKGVPYFDENRVPSVMISRGFWEMMAAKERDLSTFLNRYYDKSPSMRYTHLNRVCRIKELTKNKKKSSTKSSCSNEQNLSPPSYFQPKLV